jgi:AAA+ ATPase superfamily predicted ATPase
MFLGRKKEINILEMKYNSNKKEFGVIYGRRRIGKSSILTNFLKDKNCIFFQAKKDNAFGNLKSFSYELNKKYDLLLSFV